MNQKTAPNKAPPKAAAVLTLTFGKKRYIIIRDRVMKMNGSSFSSICTTQADGIKVVMYSIILGDSRMASPAKAILTEMGKSTSKAR
ncbi:MAG: hypothetical protein D3925_05210 [Candidatus Electrothrix sp. AR5]|nr:hypothetical protein [Candidatus Electrothrix sp. AR5]